MKKILIGLGIVVIFGLGVWLTQKYYTFKELQVQEQSQILLEKIKNVYKVVTVEGYFTEIYDYKDHWGYDISLFRKKALIQVKAKVSVGYDLDKMNIVALPDEQKIVISNLPKPTIISVDHELEYYDISEGTFNAFSTKDYSTLNSNAKQFIIEKAKESNLLQSAEKQGNQALEMMKFMAENSGWTIELKQELVGASTLEQFSN